MLTSDTITKLAGALAKAQSELEHAKKDSTNPHFKSKYADLAGVVDTIRPTLAKHDLSVVQGFVPTQDGVTLETRIVHASGEWISDEGLYLPADTRKAQAFGSAATYARRYALMALVGVAPDDDDDGNAASAKPAPKQAKPRTKPTPAEPDAPEYVSTAQAKELTEAAIAAGVDPALAKRRAQITLASDFVKALTKLKEQANA
jgi:hypothetical protein